MVVRHLQSKGQNQMTCITRARANILRMVPKSLGDIVIGTSEVD